MIENKEIGLKATENEKETYWTNVKTATEKDIKSLKDNLRFHNAVLEMANKKIKESKKEEKKETSN